MLLKSENQISHLDVNGNVNQDVIMLIGRVLIATFEVHITVERIGLFHTL